MPTYTLQETSSPHSFYPPPLNKETLTCESKSSLTVPSELLTAPPLICQWPHSTRPMVHVSLLHVKQYTGLRATLPGSNPDSTTDQFCILKQITYLPSLCLLPHL